MHIYKNVIPRFNLEPATDQDFDESRKTQASSMDDSINQDLLSQENIKQEIFSKQYTHPQIVEKMKEKFAGGDADPAEAQVEEKVEEEPVKVEQTKFTVELTAFDAATKIKI